MKGRIEMAIPDGCVNVLLVDVLAQVHGCMGLAHADDGLQVAHCYGHALAHRALPSQLCVHLSPRTSHIQAFARGQAYRAVLMEEATMIGVDTTEMLQSHSAPKLGQNGHRCT